MSTFPILLLWGNCRPVLVYCDLVPISFIFINLISSCLFVLSEILLIFQISIALTANRDYTDRSEDDLDLFVYSIGYFVPEEIQLPMKLLRTELQHFGYKSSG